MTAVDSPDPVDPSGADGAGDVTGPLADELAAAVLAVEGVTRLHTGVLDEIGTYLPGRRVGGIRVRGEVTEGQGSVEVHVVVAPGPPVRATAQAVHAVVAQHLARHDLTVPVLVHVDDVAEPDGPTRTADVPV